MESLLLSVWAAGKVLGDTLLWAESPMANVALFIGYGAALVVFACIFMHVDRYQ
jgi:hypothetical protein